MPRDRRPLRRLLAAAIGTALVAVLPVVTPSSPVAKASTPAPGYLLAGADGSVYAFGSAKDSGSLRGTPLARPVVGMAPTPSGAGYWMVASDGGIFSFGDAGFHGSTGNLKLNQPIVGMAATPSGKGYWFVAADGGIFSFGDAGFYGSTGATKLNRPIVGMAPTPSGKGYWFVASDGGIFSFGDAGFYGSTGAVTLAKPIVGMAASPAGKGYWFVASDGGIFNFGDAAFLGSAGGKSLPGGIVSLVRIFPGGAPGTPGTTATTRPGPTDPTATTTTSPPSEAAFQMGIVGDSGYRSEQHAIFDDVVADMNGFPLAFVAHAGDFKDPIGACTDRRFENAKTAFDKSEAPFVYTPGDNEWMDCGLSSSDPKDPIERLTKIRELFFAEDRSLGTKKMPLATQRPAGYPENARWIKEGVVFATLNAPGPNDNVPNADESNARRQANVAWLTETFDEAEHSNAPAVMIIWQVNPWQPNFRQTWTYLLDTLKQRTLAFGKPVVLVHGDTHVFRIDKGGWPDSTGAMKLGWDDVPNFTRVETYAAGPFSAQSATMEPHKWIRVTVDPVAPQVFSFATRCLAVGGFTCP